MSQERVGPTSPGSYKVAPRKVFEPNLNTVDETNLHPKRHKKSSKKKKAMKNRNQNQAQHDDSITPAGGNAWKKSRQGQGSVGPTKPRSRSSKLEDKLSSLTPQDEIMSDATYSFHSDSSKTDTPEASQQRPDSWSRASGRSVSGDTKSKDIEDQSESKTPTRPLKAELPDEPAIDWPSPLSSKPLQELPGDNKLSSIRCRASEIFVSEDQLVDEGELVNEAEFVDEASEDAEHSRHRSFLLRESLKWDKNELNDYHDELANHLMKLHMKNPDVPLTRSILNIVSTQDGSDDERSSEHSSNSLHGPTSPPMVEFSSPVDIKPSLVDKLTGLSDSQILMNQDLSSIEVPALGDKRTRPRNRRSLSAGSLDGRVKEAVGLIRSKSHSTKEPKREPSPRASLTDALNRTTDELEGVEERLHKKDKQIRQLKKYVETHRQQLVNLQQSCTIFQTQLEKKDEFIKRLFEKVDRLEERNAELSSRNAELSQVQNMSNSYGIALKLKHSQEFSTMIDAIYEHNDFLLQNANVKLKRMFQTVVALKQRLFEYDREAANEFDLSDLLRDNSQVKESYPPAAGHPIRLRGRRQNRTSPAASLPKVFGNGISRYMESTIHSLFGNSPDRQPQTLGTRLNRQSQMSNSSR